MNKFVHWVAALVLIGLPFIINSHAPFLDLSIGAVLNAIYLGLSHLVNPTIAVSKVQG